MKKHRKIRKRGRKGKKKGGAFFIPVLAAMAAPVIAGQLGKLAKGMKKENVKEAKQQIIDRGFAFERINSLK